MTTAPTLWISSRFGDHIMFYASLWRDHQGDLYESPLWISAQLCGSLLNIYQREYYDVKDDWIREIKAGMFNNAIY